MASWDTDIVDSHLGLVASSELELALLWGHREKMDVSWGVLIQRHRLKKDVVALSLRGDFVYKIDNLVDSRSNFEGIWVHLLANLALESLPVEWSDILVGGTWWLLLLLGEDPVLQAFEMNKTYWTFAFTSNDQRICIIVVVTPTDSALDLVSCQIWHVLRGLHL